ncbi:unnamed protein product [Closterium sp. Naga37s-1]|nr:unnamed protein product [Closterium sp. Naga37s-1]
MFCAISGVTPEDPVVSVKSGLLFERRLIEKAIAETGSCPVTGETLTADDLVSVKTNKAVKPRPLQAASIPGMLTLFQNEWDAVALRDFALEKQLNTAREELSHALYQSDAACRVIARLIRERDEARLLLAQAEQQMRTAVPQGAPHAAAAAASMPNGKRAGDEGGAEGEENARAAKRAKQQAAGITDAIIAEMTACNAKLSSQRKKRQISSSLAAPDAVEKYTQLSSHPLHKTTKPGILALDIHPQQNRILTGGVDASAVVFARDDGQIVATLTGHTKRVCAVKFVAPEDLLLTASADKTVRVWRGNEDSTGYECQHVLKEHTAEVRAVTVHATKKYFVSASADKTWAFFDLTTGACLTQVADESLAEGYTSASFHPDGLILGTGTAESLVRIWDVKTQANVAKFEGHSGPITAISFSENGYFLATAASDGVKLWDLRKLKNFRTFAPFEATTPTNSVRFDFSGSYLAMAGSDVRVIQVGTVKQEWNSIKTIPDLSGTGKVTCAEFGPDASYVAVAAMDRNLRIFGLPSSQPAADADAAAEES